MNILDSTKKFLFSLVVLAIIIAPGLSAAAQQVDPALFSAMKWRLVGPFRGGRALTAAGVRGNPSLFYFGSVGGGVWKTTDAGLTWNPIFDGQSIASIGALAVAPSDANVIYVGTGEADMREDITYGDGMYKSTDAGVTWTKIGLPDSRQIGRILVDPTDADIVYVAVLGHAYGASAERGVYKTTDGGKTWTAILQKDNDTGAIDLAFDPQDAHIIYASLWQTRRPPWDVYPPSNGPGSGLYKSTDAGATWTQLKNGLPVEGLGRIGIAVAPTEHNRVYAIVDAKDGGLYRSDDAGATWTRADAERRIWGRGWYFGVVEVDTKNPDVVYVSNTSLYKSTDGGKSFTSFKGAPGGDDYHSIWIAPEDPQRIILSTDQGTVLSLNGGKTWSSWYNQPTGQMYHVATDKRFPYWIYGAQQDSGAISVISRSSSMAITERDARWIPPGGESGMVAPDPLDTNIVFGGTVTRYDWSTNQDANVSPIIGRTASFRDVWTLPVVFSEADGHKLYAARQVMFRSTNGGRSWDEISPDLTRENPGVPANLDPITAKYGLASPRKGVIFTIAPSPLDANMVWAGTDDGLIHVTRDDGKTWKDVTPKPLTAWSKVGIIEASHFDKQTAYAAVDRHRLEDNAAYIYRTRDGGQTWQSVAKGIPNLAFVNAVREDPTHRGLLFAGTELGVYVSFNDGDDWQPLQMNLPVASVRDLSIRNDDLVIGTHGRAFWVLDDIGPLREASAAVASEAVHLYKPVTAYRVRAGSDQGTPYPPEIPHGDNPPNGASIDYYLNAASTTPVTLEILDAKGALVKKFASTDRVPPVDEKALDFPAYWVKPQPVLSAEKGMHRWIWDVRYAAPEGAPRGRRGGGGPLAQPGQYSLRLTVDGKSYTQPLEVKLDPRVKAMPAELQQQFAASQQAMTGGVAAAKALAQASEIAKQLKEAQTKAAGNKPLADALAQFNQRLTAIIGPPPEGYGSPVTPVNTDRTSMRYLQGAFAEVMGAVQSADVTPTTEQMNALTQSQKTLAATQSAWQQLLAQELPKLNAQLKQAGLPELK